MYKLIKLKVQLVNIVPLADVSSSIDKETGIVLHCSSTYFFLDILYFQIAVSLKTREIHFKRGQSEVYVGLAMKQVRYGYIFLLVC